MIEFGDLISLLAALIGVVSVTATGKMIQYARAATAKAGRLEKSARGAVQSSQLERLTSYLLDEVGSLRLVDLTTDNESRFQFEEAIDEIAEFVQLTEEQGDLEHSKDERSVGHSRWPESWVTEFTEGETWNALARMRHDVELQLRRLARDADMDLVETSRGAGQLLRRLSSAERIRPDLAGELGYAISVANEGIHGLEVDPESARQALSSAAWAMSELERTV